MKKMWKRFVSLLLACTLLAGMLPLSASAQATAPTSGEAYEWVQNKIKEIQATVPAGETPYTVGKTYRIGNSDVFQITLLRSYQDNEGNSASDAIVLILPGDNGENYSTPDYNSAEDTQPWAASHPSQIYIAKGVEGIGNYTFASNSNMNKVVFQDASTLNYIGQRAFYDDDNAVFTDEGNEGENATLNLSNVNKMGEYAFYNCDKLTGVELGGNITAVETVEGKTEKTKNKIPNHAFTSTGVQSITVPSGIEEVGEYAFYDCPLNIDPYISLQEGLKTIGNYAFGKNDAAPNTMMTSLTIPSSVESIGDHAFYNYKGLQTVTVLGEDNGGAGASALTHVGGAAFGDADHNAYSTTTTIQDAVHPEIEYTGLVGTQFYLPKELEKNDNLFVNGETCYTGDISPLTFDLTVPATCTTDGYNQYYQTVQDTTVSGEPLKLHVQVKIPALGHDWDEGNLVTVAATCETPSYKYEPCTRGCGEINIINDHVADALSHNYQVNENGGVMNPGIKKSNNTPTTVTYTCQNYKDGDGNLHDGDLDASYTWTIPATTLSATTSDTLADLQLPSVTGDTQAYLQWDDSVNKDTKLEEGTRNYQVKLVVSNDSNFQPYTDDSFTIEVRVEKTKLDFSDVHFENSTRWIGGDTPDFSVEGMPEGTSEVKKEYKKKGDTNAEWTEETPEEDSTDDTGEYLVRYTFRYNSTIYDLVTNDPDLLPPDGYTLKKTEDGEGTITGDYRVAQMTMEDVSIRAIDNLTFNGTSGNIEGTSQPTVQLDGVLTGSNVTFSWTENGETEKESIPSTTSSTFSGASITNAGTYEITVRVENGEYAPVEKRVIVTIAKQTLTAPRAELTVRYDTTEKTGVPDSTDGRYTVSDNKQTNAGTYTAKATVINPSNYQWPASVDPDNNGTAEISWQILHRLLAKPTIPISQYQYKEGTYRQPVTTTSQDIAISYEDDKLVATFRGQTAYTATNAKETNAEDYTVTVHLENNNYKWADDQSTTDLTLSWRITPLQIAAPTITAPSATYTGEAYAGQVTLEHSKASDSRGSSQDIIDLDKTKSNIRYYTQQTGGNGGDAPVNAGTYYAGVESDGWAFVDGKVETNYQIIRGARDPFSITKATAKMTFDQKEVKETYTADGTTLQPVTVTGLVDADKDNPASEVYNVTYTYKYRTDSSTTWEEVNTETKIEEPNSFKFTDVGEYQITAKWGAGTVSNNYTATDATYTLTIKKADKQSITLTPDKQGTWTAAEGQTPAKYTITYGEAATFKVTGTAALDKENADISYAVNGDSNVVSVDGSSGVVTIHKAGTATITVTAADTDNVKGASVEYTVTVKKAKPTVNTNLPDNKLEVAYTGNPITGYNKATPTADVVAEAKQPTGDITYTFYRNEGCTEKFDDGAGGTVPIAVGTYYMKATYPGDKNYTSAESEAVTVTVTEAQLTVDAKGYTDTYDGKPHDPASITVTGVNGVISSGYTISYAKKTDGQTDAPAADSGAWKTDTQVKDVADSGDYWIKVVIKDDDSYNAYIDSVNVDIDPKPLTVTKTVTLRKTYDGTTKATVDFDTITTGITGELVTADLVSAVYNSPNVEQADTITITYKLTADPETDTDLANYSLDGKAVTGAEMDETVTEGVGITPASITVDIEDQKKVYDGSVATPSQSEWSVDEEKLYDVDGDGTKDNLGITLSIDSGSKNAGTYAIIGEAGNDNYDVIFTGSWKGEEHKSEAGTYTITPRPIDVKIGNAEGFYGDEPVLDNVTLDDVTEDGVSNAGLVDGEVLKEVLTGLELATIANAQSDISDEDTTYTIYAKKGGAPVQAPTQLGNYNVTFTNKGTYTVKPRPITITIVDHSSVYGAEINEGIDNPVSDKDYKVAITGNATTGDAIVNNDVLTVTLETTASAKAAAGTYDITGSAEGNKVNNYAITWAGNGGARDDEQGQNGRYTIKPAQLDIAFTQGDQVTNGVSINITDSYNANPLVLKNASTDAKVSEADKSTLDITYSIGTAGGGTGDVSQIAEIDKTTGEVTILKTGTVRITATVTPQGNSNYTGQVTTWYELNIIGGGQMALKVTPKTNLAYTGEPQELIETPICSLDSAKIQYSLDNQDWKDTIPTGTNAGTYTVYVKATDSSGQYSDVTEHVMVTIDKADLKGSFAHDPYPHVLATDGNNYDSATANPLTITSQNYKAKPANYTYYSDNMQVASSANGTSTIVITGTAGQSATIRVTVPGDDNYNGKTFTYKLEISNTLSDIQYDVTGTEATYNGQPQTIAVNVTAPASGATVMYQDKDGNYTLSEPPAYTNVQEGGYPIKFQITAPGYNTVTGEATLTIEPKKITETVIAGIAESYTYTGKEITFDDAISVHDEGVLLEKDKDYTITYDDNKEVGKGSVTITGTGNYKESVTKNFTISPVDASDLTASLDRTFGYYGDSNTNNATVTVTHGRHTVDSSEITLTVIRQDSTIESGDVVKEGLKLTFNKAGIYTIHVEVSGTHKGAFDLTYTLLPQDVASDDFQVATDPEDRVWTYDGGNRAFGVTVTSGETSLQKGVDFTLRYTYLPYVGNPTDDVYDPGTTVFTEAGIYTVIVEGTGNYTGHAELVALIQPRDLSDAGVTATFAQTELVYNGEAQEPGVTLTYNGTAITQLKDTEYYGNTNAGEAQALSAASAGCNNFTGARVDAFTIEKKSLNDSTITAKADPEEYYYTGHPVTPAVTVTDSGRNADLSIGADYTVTSDAVGPGKVTATVTGTGNYKDTVKVEFTILPTGAEPVETLDLTVTPSEWTWDNGKTKAAISVTFNGKELNDTDYELTVSKDGETPKTVKKAEAVELLSAPGKYTITATGVGAYNGSTDTETVTIQKIQPEVTVTATPNSLSGGGKVTLTLKGEKLPDGTDLKNLLKVTAKNDSDVTLEDLHIQWPEDGSLTAELTLPNTNETYTFTLTFTGNEYYEAATASEQVVVAQQIISGGGGGPVEDQPADPDDTGVSDWLNTKDHLAYLAGYPGGIFGPDQNMTRAEAAQMFYNLLLEKDVEITVEFEDVPADAWYAKPVNTLASLGILSGVGNGRFDPERSITRAEFTVIAMKFANTSGGGVNIFSDVNEDDWFYSAVVDSTQYGWINGYPDGTFRPEATISRAEVTVIVNHMLGRAADRPYVIAHEEELNTFGDVNRGHWGYFHIAEATNAHEYHTEDGTESWTGLS